MTVAMLEAEEVAAPALPRLAALLAEAGLPSDDLAEPGRRFWCFRDAGGGAIGSGGLELYGTEALLRSVVVVAARRRSGLGRGIVARLLGEAGARGARRVFLLTTTAEAFFAALGFAVIERAAVPAVIAATREFTTLCPASAVCMTKALPPDA
ncbi:MAG: arsenic resistance N-acetyltransferase ArsN2 [Stellaceae bacterium]